MTSLLTQKCKPCTGNTPKMSIDKIEQHLLKIDNWKLNENKEMVFKKFKFKNFKKALQFTNSVGIIAEEEGHHPDISIGWGYCLIIIHTHAIKGLSINDFILAAKIDQLINN